jgi:hypothetical protein
MPTDATFESFEKELNRLVEKFGRNLAELKGAGYDEAKLRLEYLDPLFRALGWDLENRDGLIQKEREVEIESATQIGGGRKRADYLFRADKRERFVCEAKKPAEELNARYAFQTKRYAWNKNVWLGVLTDFEEIKIYIVGSKPYIDEPHVGLWKTWHFRQYPLIARELWDLLARDKIAAGSIEQVVESLPKKATGTGKARQQWLIKPDRTRALDSDFLKFLDDTRRDLASDIYKNNDHDELLAGNKLTEACQRVIDRILFLRICEDRDIDTGRTLQSIVETWRKNTGDDDTGRRAHQQPFELREEPPANYGGDGIRAPKESLWRAVVRHFRALDRRPPTHVPFFNGNLFKPHFTETLVIGDEWLAGFISELSDDETPYLFNYIDVEILGSVYERFLGKVVVLKGRGISVDDKPEVRKAGGVYYTPRYIVDYIVEQTAGKLLDEIAAEKETEGVKAFAVRTEKLRLLDPACGSGSFLIRAFERVCEHWQKRLTANLRQVLECAGPPALSAAGEKRQRAAAVQDAGATAERKAARAAWEKKHRPLCWVDAQTNDVHLTVALKRQILTQNIYGVDLDAAAVEVTQLSLYLKMLENENRTTLQRQRELLADEDDIALLPPLQDNIKCGNSLIASDFSMMPEDLVRVHAFDWPVQFAPILKAGGFDAVIGNPPYLSSAGQESISYFNERYHLSEYQTDFYTYFIEKALNLVKRKGKFSFIVSDSWMKAENFSKLRNHLLGEHRLLRLAVFDFPPFEGATIENSVLVVERGEKPALIPMDRFTEPGKFQLQSEVDPQKSIVRGLIDPMYSEEALSLIAKMELGCVPLESLVELNRGIHAYRTDGYGKTRFGKGPQTKRDKDEQSYHAKKAVDSTYLPEIKGKDVFRFEFVPTGDFISYGDWLAEAREPKYFQNPKVTVRKVLGKKLHGTFIREPMAIDQSLYILISPKNDSKQLKFILGILMSGIGAWYLRTKYAIYDTLYPWYTRKQLAAFPIKPHDDKLVVLVDKLLGLMPKLRAATAESEKAVLQNAVTATDQQIDSLVYERYGLTEEEKNLVGGNA